MFWYTLCFSYLTWNPLHNKSKTLGYDFNFFYFLCHLFYYGWQPVCMLVYCIFWVQVSLYDCSLISLSFHVFVPKIHIIILDSHYNSGFLIMVFHSIRPDPPKISDSENIEEIRRIFFQVDFHKTEIYSFLWKFIRSPLIPCKKSAGNRSGFYQMDFRRSRSPESTYGNKIKKVTSPIIRENPTIRLPAY